MADLTVLIRLHKHELDEKRQALGKLYTALAGDAPTSAFYRTEEAYTTWTLAGMLDRAGRSEAAAIEYRQAITFHEKAMARFVST